MGPELIKSPSAFGKVISSGESKTPKKQPTDIPYFTKSVGINNNYNNNYNNGSAYPDTSLSSVTIDLTGPLPVINVLKRDHQNGQSETATDSTTINLNSSLSSTTTTANNSTQVSGEKLYHKLIREAPLVPLVKPESTIEDKGSPWDDSDTKDINPKLLSEGKKFIRRNFFALIFAHLVSIAFLLAVKPIQALLLRTGSIHQKENTLRRYLSLITCVKNLYECDLLIESSQNDTPLVVTRSESRKGSGGSATTSNSGGVSTKSKTNVELKTIRKIQRKVAHNFRIYAPPPMDCMKLSKEEDQLLQVLKEDLELMNEIDTSNMKNLDKIYTTVNPDVPLSQYDMAMVQFTFFGFVSLFPKIFGIHETEKGHPDGLKGFIHYWAVLGKRLGLEDKYNLCLEMNYDPETNMKIFKDIFLFSFKIADETLIKLWRTMTSGSSRYFYFFRTKSMLQFMVKNVAGIENAISVFSDMSLGERICYHSYTFVVNWVLKLWFTRTLMNLMSKGVFYLGYKLYLRRVKEEKFGIDNSLFTVSDEQQQSIKTIS